MTTAKELRQYCEKLHEERKEELKCILNDYFETTFIVANIPFRAVIGNKKCKPIPIYQAFSAFYGETLFDYKFKWPNFSDELLCKELENLGFIITQNRISISVPPEELGLIITKNRISISVPPEEKGIKLSFAQEWVKKINAHYSEYCAKEKKIANEVYSDFVSALLSTPVESIKTYDEYTLFCDFRFNRKISSKGITFIRRLMMRDGIEEYYEDGKYKGIKVYNSHQIN